MGYTGPPLEPRTRRMMECNDCEGTGKAEEPSETEECEKCEGTGELDFDPDCDPYAADNWREWEGIA